MNIPMKHVIYFVIFLTLSFSLSGNSSKDSVSVYMQRANEAYQLNNFEDAITLYSQVVDLRYESAVLYYNLGNAYFKSGDNARALLWLERALRLDPNNEDIIHNINFIQQKLIDRIERLPEWVILKFWNKCSGFLTGNQWAILSIIVCSLFALCLLIVLLIRISWVRSISIFIATLALIFTILSVIFAKKESTRYIQHPQGIIMGYVVNVKSTPNEKSSDLFVIHSGLKVGITDHLNEWIEIRLPNGEKGWILSIQIEEI